MSRGEPLTVLNIPITYVRTSISNNTYQESFIFRIMFNIYSSWAKIVTSGRNNANKRFIHRRRFKKKTGEDCQKSAIRGRFVEVTTSQNCCPTLEDTGTTPLEHFVYLYYAQKPKTPKTNDKKNKNNMIIQNQKVGRSRKRSLG